MNNLSQALLDKIEILPVSLLDENRRLVNDLKKLASSLQLEFGWHYLLDLCWIIANLGDIPGKRILDAGAGTGVLQWYLADHSATVISVDRMNRANLALKYRKRFQVKGFRNNNQSDLAPIWLALPENLRTIPGVSQKLAYLSREIVCCFKPKTARGQILMYSQDLSNLEGIADDSIDAIVSLSALEHNEPKHLEVVVRELMRVIKPGGILLATLGAARDKDWFHQPSHGWCYSESTLRWVFALPGEVPSNYHLYDTLFNSLYDSAELRENLAKFYSRSGDNGMPWGIWEPHYQSVGILKTKLA
jgi:2-polyprenyl-3-methyl-5-hydroxy-6-metoxy-1,4-benzoquinol methylase